MKDPSSNPSSTQASSLRVTLRLVAFVAAGLLVLPAAALSVPLAQAGEDLRPAESSGFIVTLLLADSPPRFIGSPLGMATSLAVYDAPLARAVALVDPNGQTVGVANVRVMDDHALPGLPDHYYLFWHVVPNAPGVWSLAYAENGTRIASIPVTQVDLASAAPPIPGTPGASNESAFPQIPSAPIGSNSSDVGQRDTKRDATNETKGPQGNATRDVRYVGNVTNDTMTAARKGTIPSLPAGVEASGTAGGSQQYQGGMNSDGTPAGSTWCAKEGDVCSFGGSRDVLYGVSSQYYKRNSVSGSISCTNDAFGDPNYGSAKACYTNNGPTGTSWCSNEGGTCSFSGTKDVAYGANGQWVYQHNVVGETSCSNSAFGSDPSYGDAKACFTVDGSGSGGGSGSGSSTGKVGPSGYTFCADENQHCSFSGTKDVAYGDDPSCTSCWAYQHSVTGGTDCNNDVFGDPDQGVAKACYTKDQTTTGANTGPSAGYVYCADENTHCYFSGTMDVAYGRDNNWNYKYAVTGGIDCNNAQFGDPDYGYAKACYTQSSGTGNTNTPPPDPNYSYCATEGSLCSFSGTADVAYGANGQYNYKYGLTGSIQCSNDQFGDPAPGYQKKCYTKPASSSSAAQCGWYYAPSGEYATDGADTWHYGGQSMNDIDLFDFARSDRGVFDCGGNTAIDQHQAWSFAYEFNGANNVPYSKDNTYTMTTDHGTNGCRSFQWYGGSGSGSVAWFCFETLDPQIGIRRGPTTNTPDYWYSVGSEPTNGIGRVSRDGQSAQEWPSVHDSVHLLNDFVTALPYGWVAPVVADLFSCGDTCVSNPNWAVANTGTEDYVQYNYEDAATPHNEGMQITVHWSIAGTGNNHIHGGTQAIGTIYDLSDNRVIPVQQMTHTIELEDTVRIYHA